MKTNAPLDRRHFLRAGLFGAAAVSFASNANRAVGAVTKPVRDPFDGLKLGITSYTFRHFNLDQALELTRQAGAKYISLKDMHLPLKSGAAECQQAHAKVEAAGLVLLGGGVIYLKNDPTAVRAAFEYAKAAGMPTIITSPDIDALDLMETTAKEFDIRVAIHNHGPGDNKYPSPLDVWRLVKDRDARLGLCVDVGHTVRLGEDPVAIIRQCATRLYDFHMKDEDRAAPKASTVPVGKGIIDIVGVLKALIEIKYAYNVALEYEADENNPMPGVLESFAYMRGVLAAI